MLVFVNTEMSMTGIFLYGESLQNFSVINQKLSGFATYALSTFDTDGTVMEIT